MIFFIFKNNYILNPIKCYYEQKLYSVLSKTIKRHLSDESIFSMVQLAMAKDPEAAFFKRLEGLQPCEVSELKAGTHIFAVYGSPSLFPDFMRVMV